MRSGPLYSVAQLPCIFIGPSRMQGQRIGGKFLLESTHPHLTDMHALVPL